MGDMSADAVTYLPASLVRAAAAHPARELPWCDEVDGTMVMADLSGFTNLSERLGKLGDEGAERLTGTINSFFERMLDTACGYGGDTLTFGGDAILLLFDGEDHASRAVTAGLAMLKQTGRAAAIDAGDGKVKIGMSVGAHSGTFLLAGAGLADERAHLFVLGRGAETTALAESAAERGQMAVSAATKKLLPGGSRLGRAGEFWRVDELTNGRARLIAPGCERPASAGPPGADESGRQLAPFLPPYARMATVEGSERVTLTPEHRRVSIVFINILGLNELIDEQGSDAAVDQLQAYATMVARLSTRHHGFVVSTDIATRGSKLIVTFGAPVAHEYAAANAARFALDLCAELRESGLDLQHKVGVNGGHVFAGEVGPSFRRQYTVMGDAVNLSARLMAAAEPGEALASTALAEHAGPNLCARQLAPISVKGKAEPVSICVLEKESRDGAATGGGANGGAGAPARRGENRMFGRRAELKTLGEAWDAARQGTGCIVLVEGEAGVGKTRLVDEALHEASAAGLVTRAACFEHLQAAPFTPWVDVLSSIFGLAPGASTSERDESVRSYLEARVPEHLEVGSLLNPLLVLSLPQGEVVGSLDSAARRERLFEIIARILSEAAGDRGLVVVIEDIHWIDESSLALVRRLGERRAAAGVLLLLTARPMETPLELESETSKRIELAELTEAESLEMVCEALGLDGLPLEVGEALYAKTRGNPLFLEEVVRSLQAPGVLERILGATSVARAAELASLEIPDRVQGLLMSRIDGLPADTREVLKAGSVVGRSFDAFLLDGIADDLLRRISLERAFAELVEASLVVPAGEDRASGSVAFRHALVQEVAYESMPFSRRRELHRLVGRYLEATQQQPDHGLLVHHYRHAGEVEKTRLHAVRASESSVAAYAGLEAIDYLGVALGATKGRNSADACVRSRLEELTGDSCEALGRGDDAIAFYKRARRRWRSPNVRRAATSALKDLAPLADGDARDGLLCWKIAHSLERGHSAYQRALDWLDTGATALPAGSEGMAARMLVSRSGLLSRLGRFREAAEAGEQGLALARQEGDPAQTAYALTMLGTAMDGLGLLERAIACHTEAIAHYDQIGDLWGLAMGHLNLSASFQLAGDLRASLVHDETALALFARIGNFGGVVIQHLNVGVVLLEMGEVGPALEHLREAIGLRDRQGVNPLVTGSALIFLGRALLWSDDLPGARRALDEGRTILEHIDAQGALLDAGIIEAELCLALGDLDGAERASANALKSAKSMDAELGQAQALCALGSVRLARGDPVGATARLEACVSLAEKSGSDYERAKALVVLAEAQSACAPDDVECIATFDEAIRILEKVGARHDLDKAVALRERRTTPAAGEGRRKPGPGPSPARSRSAAS